MIQKKLLSAVVLAATLGASAAHADMVKLDGAGFDVWYDSALTGLFGTPALLGGQVVFSPANFSAESTSGTVLTHDALNLKITLDAGYRFNNLSLTERGNYSLLGTASQAQVQGITNVFAVSAPGNVVSQAFTSSTALTQNDGMFHAWEATSTQDLSGAGWTNAGELHYNLDNALVAYASDAGVGPSYSLINKNFVGLNVGVAPVPEPETYAMLLAGLGMVGLIARRRMNNGP